MPIIRPKITVPPVSVKVVDGEVVDVLAWIEGVAYPVEYTTHIVRSSPITLTTD